MLHRSCHLVKNVYQSVSTTYSSIELLYVVDLGRSKRNLSFIVKRHPKINILLPNNHLIRDNDKNIYAKLLSTQKKETAPTTEVKKILKDQMLHEQEENKQQQINLQAPSTKKSEVILDNIQEKSLEVESDKKKWINILTSSEKPKKDVKLENVEEKSLEVDKPPEAAKVVDGTKEEALLNLKNKILEVVTSTTDKVTEKPPPVTAKPKRQRKPIDLSASSLERNFITPARAMQDFALKQSDLESLPKTLRRSPYEMEPPITVYWRKDVERKALEVWGSKENLQKELFRRVLERKMHQQNLFTIKRRLKDYRKELGREAQTAKTEGLFGRSGRVVMTAVAINATNFFVKFFAWLYTGSHSMFSECIHSLADTINQLILAYGIQKSVQNPDSVHPYGYTNMKHVASLISGVGIFCVGAGLSFYHGVIGLIEPEPLVDFFWAYIILSGSFVSEGLTLYIAVNSIRKSAKEANMNMTDYIMRGQDPSVNVVLLEDAAAVTGVALAAGCMGLSSITGSPIPDAVGSLLVGSILGAVASFIIYTNVAALVGRSIPDEHLQKINSELEADVMIRAIHDVKGIDMGNSLVRYKAEVDFDGRELTRSYLDKQDLNNMLEEVKKFETVDELEEFILKHAENIVDMMGAEIDRIELKLKKKFPEIRHCDLEIL